MRLSTRISVENCINAIKQGYDGVKQIRERKRCGYFWVRLSRAKKQYSPSGKLYDLMFTYSRPPDNALFVLGIPGATRPLSKTPRRDSRALVWGLTYGMLRTRAQETLNRKLTTAELDEVAEAFAEQLSQLDGGWPEIVDGIFADLRIYGKED